MLQEIVWRVKLSFNIPWLTLALPNGEQNLKVHSCHLIEVSQGDSKNETIFVPTMLQQFRRNLRPKKLLSSQVVAKKDKSVVFKNTLSALEQFELKRFPPIFSTRGKFIFMNAGKGLIFWD